MKQLVKCLSIFFPLILSAQIQIDDVGDGWKNKVEQALDIVQKYDPEKYTLLMENCEHISYSLLPFSTTESGTTILISQKEILKGNIDDIAAILVHESLHLYLLKNHIKMAFNEEEILCYTYELELLFKIPNVEPWLLSHAKAQIEFYINP
jgi:predicted metal-dependent peptidase